MALVAAIVECAERHFQSYLDGGRAAVGIEDVGKAFRRKRDQTLGKLFGRFMREARENHLIELGGLLGDGSDDARMAVAVRHHPP